MIYGIHHDYIVGGHNLTTDIDHGSIAGLDGDDHPQYIKDSEFTQYSGVLVGTNAGTFQEETGATLRTSLGLGTGDTPTFQELTVSDFLDTPYAEITTLDLGVVDLTAGVLNIFGGTSGTVQIRTADAAGTYALTLPTTAGDASQFLQTNGSGVLSWAAVNTDLVNDTTPKLGGDLDGQSTYDITGIVDLTASGDITTSAEFTGSTMVLGDNLLDAQCASFKSKAGAVTKPVIRLTREDTALRADYGFYFPGYRFAIRDLINSIDMFGLAYLWVLDVSLTNVTAGRDDGSYGSGLPGCYRAPHADTRGTDTSGGNLYLASGQGEGAGAVSSISLMTPSIQASGSTTQPYVKRVTVAEGLVSITEPLTVTGLSTLTGGAVIGTAASDPKHATPASRPAGVVAQLMYYSGKLYFCTNAATPTWEMITSA